MQAGNLKHKIAILENQNNGTTDPDPGDWKTICEVWAAKKGFTGSLFYAAAVSQSGNDSVFTIRYRKGIKPGMHIVEGTEQPYEIYSEPIDVADGHQWLEIHARRTDVNGS